MFSQEGDRWSMFIKEEWFGKFVQSIKHVHTRGIISEVCWNRKQIIGLVCSATRKDQTRRMIYWFIKCVCMLSVQSEEMTVRRTGQCRIFSQQCNVMSQGLEVELLQHFRTKEPASLPLRDQRHRLPGRRYFRYSISVYGTVSFLTNTGVASLCRLHR